MEMLVNISLAGSILILLVLAVRPLLKKAPRWASAGLWLLPFGRLLIPYSGMIAPVSALPQGVAAFWAVGVAALLLYGAGTTLYLYRLIQGAVEYEDRVFVRDEIDFPFALERRIYMPFEEDTARRTWLVRQYRRRNTVLALAVRCAVFAAVAVHWFNPLVWVALWLLRRDWDVYHDDAVLREVSLLPCAVAAPPRWLRLCPWAAFQTGVAKRRAVCEEQTASADQKKRPAAVLSAVVAVAAALTLMPPLPEKAPVADPEPLRIEGTYYMKQYTYRSPFAAGLVNDDEMRYDFSNDRLVIIDKFTGDTVQVCPLAGVFWQAIPYTEAQWGRLLWWVDPEELPYLNAQYVALNSSIALLKTGNGLYLLWGSMLGTGQDTVTSICALTTEAKVQVLNTKLPEGLYVSERCVSCPPALSTSPGNDSGYLYYFKNSSVKITERRSGTFSQFPVMENEWTYLLTKLDKKDYDWMAGILGGYDVLQTASFYQLYTNRYLILSGEKLYIGDGWVQERLNSVTGGNIYLLQKAQESSMPQQGRSHSIWRAAYGVSSGTLYGNEQDAGVRARYIEIREKEIQVWYDYDASISFSYDPEDGQWIYFPVITGSSNSKISVSLSGAYVRKLNDREFLLQGGGALFYGIGIWDKDTGWLQIQLLYELNRTLTNPYKSQ